MLRVLEAGGKIFRRGLQQCFKSGCVGRLLGSPASGGIRSSHTPHPTWVPDQVAKYSFVIKRSVVRSLIIIKEA